MMNRSVGDRVFFFITLLLCSGCQFISVIPGLSPSSSARDTEGDNEAGKTDRELATLVENIAIETAVVTIGTLQPSSLYTGTTAPSQDVILSSEVAGKLVEMAVEVGDKVKPGQYLAQVDDALLKAQVLEQQAILAALESELIEAETDLSEAQVQVEQAQLERQQSQLDNDRIQSLAEEGAVTQQESDLAQTTIDKAQTAVQAAQEQVQSRQANVEAVYQRVEAQKAVLTQIRQQQSNTVFVSPIAGKVLQRFLEAGTTLQVGDRLLHLGHFETLTVALQISELDLDTIQLGQAVSVTLDAFSDQTMTGRISQISPAADPISRLVPVEISLPNADERIGSGLLARVAIDPVAAETMVIPKSALEIGEENRLPTVFVLKDDQTPATVTAQTVKVGDESDRLISIEAGLDPGDTIVIQSDEPLKDGVSVRLSILSEQ